jgi:hypothetical protein
LPSLINLFIRDPEPAVLKGIVISEPAVIIACLDEVLARIERVLAARAVEDARLKRVEAAAISALSDLDAMLGSADAGGMRKGG